MSNAWGIEYSEVPDENIKSWHKDFSINTKWFFIKPSQLFKNVVKRCEEDKEYASNINIKLLEIFKDIEDSARWKDSEKDLSWLFRDIDLNSNKLWWVLKSRNELLVKLLQNIRDLNLKFANNTIDAFGDAYEYLISMYAANAGKSWWEYFTPQEVSELLSKITINWKTDINNIYDPTCWSWSLLLKVSSEIEKNWQTNRSDLNFYWQEKNATTYNLCRMNMFLHWISYNKFDIQNDDTLTHPKHLYLKWQMDVIVSNPPYSINWEWSDNPSLVSDERFSEVVLAPKSKADLAFVLHSLYMLSWKWTAAIVEFPSVLTRSWDEAKIRQHLVDNNHVDTIIQLPDNIFFGTNIWTCIIVLKKDWTRKEDTSILFIDASKEFVKTWKKNKLTEENIQKIFQTYQNRKSIEHFSKLVSLENFLKDNDEYQLNVWRFVEQEDTTEKIDINELEKEIKESVENQNKLREQLDNCIDEIKKMCNL